MLVPGLEYTFETLVECVSDLGISDQLYVFVTKDEVRKLWQCGLWSFQMGYIKLERFLPKNQHTQRNFLIFHVQKLNN